MVRQFVKSECPPEDQATNGFDVTSQSSNICNSARNKEPNPNSTRGQQMESSSSNIQRTSSQKLGKAGIENIAKQSTEVKKEVKEEQPDDNLNTDVRIQNTEPDKFACLDCTAVFETKKKFEKHTLTHDDYRRYQCSLCEKRFKVRHSLLRHERIHSGEKQFKCPTCDESFIERRRYIEHQRKHTGELPFTCEDCGKSFARKDCYLQHRKIHADEKMHSCEFCGWKFINSSNLRYHLRTHTGIKPYRCLICKTRYFSTSKKWKRHVEKHHKEDYEDYAAGKTERKSTKKPYKCAVCAGTFKSPSELSRHERIHTGEKPYACNFCHKGFRLQSSFTSHLFTHSGSKPYLCIVCKIPFSTRDEMVAHKQQSHGNGSETGNMSQIATTAAAAPNISTVQGLNPKISVVTSHETNDGNAIGNSTVFVEMSSEMSIYSNTTKALEVNSAQSGSSVRKRIASYIEETRPILVKKSTKKANDISAIHAETFDDIEASFLNNEITTDPFASVYHEQVDDTPFMEEWNASELAASPRIQYKRSSMEHIVGKAARKNPHVLHIIWSEDFSLDVAAVVSRQESNCVIFVQNLLPCSLNDVYSLSKDFKLQTPNVNVGIFSEPLHCFDFGDLGLPMKIAKESAFESFTKVESKMKKFARTKGMDLVNILSYPEDANSWCNQLLQQLKGRCIVSNSA